MKKQYTKKQIQEAISYWKKRLNESEEMPSFFNELVDDAIWQDDDLYHKLGKLYRATLYIERKPGWNGDFSDYDYVTWRRAFVDPVRDEVLVSVRQQIADKLKPIVGEKLSAANERVAAEKAQTNA